MPSRIYRTSSGAYSMRKDPYLNFLIRRIVVYPIHAIQSYYKTVSRIKIMENFLTNKGFRQDGEKEEGHEELG